MRDSKYLKQHLNLSDVDVTGS